jgi:hypothetical protein
MYFAQDDMGFEKHPGRGEAVMQVGRGGTLDMPGVWEYGRFDNNVTGIQSNPGFVVYHEEKRSAKNHTIVSPADRNLMSLPL